MRGSYQLSLGGPLTPAVRVLITINVAVYIVTFLSKLIFPQLNLVLLGGLVPDLVTEKFPFFTYQFFTYMFFHGNIWHIFFNMLVLAMFGGELEKLFGTKQFYTYYFICGVGAGLFNYIVNIVFALPGMYPIIGASGAIYGLLAAYGIFYGDRYIFFMMLFPMKARTFVIVLGLIEFFSSFSMSGDGIAHLAHLGGLLCGVVYIYFKFLKKPPAFFKKWKENRVRKKFKVMVSDISEEDWNKMWKR